MPANPMRGEAQLGEHKLIVDFNGFCTLEAETGLKVGALIVSLKTGLGFLDMRTWVRVFINADMTDEEAGELIGAMRPDPVLKALCEAVDGFFAPPKKGQGGNPPKAE